jgi:hypothetical protein
MHEHHGKATQQEPKPSSFNVSRRNQQPRNTSMPTGTGVELHPSTKDGMIPFAKSNTNLPMYARKKTTIFHFASARSSVSKGTHEIHPILVHISVALNGNCIKLQPRYAVGSKGTGLTLTRSGSAGSVSRATAIDVALQG